MSFSSFSSHLVGEIRSGGDGGLSDHFSSAHAPQFRVALEGQESVQIDMLSVSFLGFVHCAGFEFLYFQTLTYSVLNPTPVVLARHRCGTTLLCSSSLPVDLIRIMCTVLSTLNLVVVVAMRLPR